MSNVLERAIALALFDMADSAAMCRVQDCAGHSIQVAQMLPDGGMVLGIQDHRTFAAELSATLVHSLTEAADRPRLREWRPPFSIPEELRQRIEAFWAKEGQPSG